MLCRLSILVFVIGLSGAFDVLVQVNAEDGIVRQKQLAS